MALTKGKAKDHLVCANTTFNIYKNLTGEEQQGWALTLLFYVALNLFHAYWVEVAPTGFDIPVSHDDRKKKVSLQFPNLRDNYWGLHDCSIGCRYKLHKYNSSQVEEYYEDDYLPIVDHLSTLPQFEGEILPRK